MLTQFMVFRATRHLEKYFHNQKKIHRQIYEEEKIMRRFEASQDAMDQNEAYEYELSDEVGYDSSDKLFDVSNYEYLR